MAIPLGAGPGLYFDETSGPAWDHFQAEIELMAQQVAAHTRPPGQPNKVPISITSGSLDSSGGAPVARIVINAGPGIDIVAEAPVELTTEFMITAAKQLHERALRAQEVNRNLDDLQP